MREAQGLIAVRREQIVGGADAPGRARVRAVIDSLVKQSQALVGAANAVGITRLTLVQPE